MFDMKDLAYPLKVEDFGFSPENYCYEYLIVDQNGHTVAASWAEVKDIKPFDIDKISEAAIEAKIKAEALVKALNTMVTTKEIK